MAGQDKEVYFDQYCKTCKYAVEFDDYGNLLEVCEECLACPSNIDSHKPVNWKEDK